MEVSTRITGDFGYTRLNAAFVLDLLACQEGRDSPETSDARRQRQEIVDTLPGLANGYDYAFLREEWWYYATMAEACFRRVLT